MLERDIRRDNYSKLQQPKETFKTYMQQESMLRQDLEGKDAQVCLHCFHIYQYLKTNFYGVEDCKAEESKTAIAVLSPRFESQNNQEKVH